ncbi:glutamate receptor ionotropic, delta-2-like isoform X1 [Scylla paramamosain]|uniref:glutamate receptor ionotropic, delta-2-like isoform X1 n=1 Tax=Scylla paramamosain TaxID=85552 RepID=UPI003082CF5A
MKVAGRALAGVITVMVWAGHRAAAGRPVPVGSRGLAASVEDVMLGTRQVAETHLAGCHLVLVSPDLYGNVEMVHRLMDQSVSPMVLLEVNTRDTSGLIHKEPTDRSLKEVSLKLAALGSSSKPSCQGLLVDHTDAATSTLSSLLYWSKRWLQSETRVVVMGSDPEANSLLDNSALRNTRLALYIAPYASSQGRRGTVQIYRRCLYCHGGNAGVQRLYRWDLDGGVPQDLRLFMSNEYKENFNGHQFRVVTMTYFPYVNYVRVSDAPGTVVRLTDSLNTRMMEALARHLNYSYEVREPEDGLWGLETTGGNWTGTVGTLQHEKADFSMELTITLQRKAVVDFCRAYIGEDMSILSLKPTPLPEYLALFRPFEGTLWVAVVVGTFVWGVALWVLLMIKHDVTERHRLSLASSLFYGWGLLLEDHPYEPPVTIAGQMLVGVWLIACFILRASYTCSFISHLVVQGKSASINDLETLVGLRKSVGWQWGTEIFDGAFNTFLTISNNSDYHTVKAHMQTMATDVGIKRVLDGGFSYMRNYYATKILIETFLTKEKGDNPFHIGTTKYPMFAGNSWAFRRGTPFISRFDTALQQLLDNGLIIHWMEDVISEHIRQKRQEVEDTSERTSPTRVVVKCIVASVNISANILPFFSF